MSRHLAVFLAIAFVATLHAADPKLEGNKPDKKAGLPDYSAWKPLTAEPLRVDRSVFLRCDLPRPEELKVRQARGPHFLPAVKFIADAAATEAIQADPQGTMKKPLPVGATIVKEKYWNETGKPTAWTAMIKREPGYDAEHGDWEYLYVELGDKSEVTRGKIKSCVQCHSIAKEKDYLFRTYLTPVQK
jgi:hypothetical protein